MWFSVPQQYCSPFYNSFLSFFLSDSERIYYYAFIFTYNWVWIQKPESGLPVKTWYWLRSSHFLTYYYHTNYLGESEMILLRIVSSVLPKKCLRRGVKLTSIPSAHCKRIVSHCSHPRDARLPWNDWNSDHFGNLYSKWLNINMHKQHCIASWSHNRELEGYIALNKCSSLFKFAHFINNKKYLLSLHNNNTINISWTHVQR